MSEFHCLSTAQAVEGYKESKIAKSENRDCVVRAIAASFEIAYDTAHEFCKDIFHRNNRCGTANTIYKFSKFLKETKNWAFSKEVTILDDNFVWYGDTKRRMTLLTFVKNNSKGNYLIIVRGHALALKDGVLVGNSNEHKHLRRRIDIAYKIV